LARLEDLFSFPQKYVSASSDDQPRVVEVKENESEEDRECVDQWYERRMRAFTTNPTLKTVRDKMSFGVTTAINFAKANKGTIAMVATGLFALIGAFVAARNISAATDGETWGLEAFEKGKGKNKKGRGAFSGGRMKYKQNTSARSLFRPKQEFELPSAGSELDPAQNNDVQSPEHEIDRFTGAIEDNEVAKRQGRRDLVKKSMRERMHDECIHYANCPEKPLLISSTELCHFDCTRRNCVHFTGCTKPEAHPRLDRCHKEHDCYDHRNSYLSEPVPRNALERKMTKKFAAVRPPNEDPAVVSRRIRNRRRAIVRARNHEYTYTANLAKSVNMKQESMLGKVKIHYREYAECVYKYVVDGQFIQTAAVFGPVVHTTLHGVHEGKVEIMNHNTVVELDNEVIPTSPDGGVYFHHGAAKSRNLQFRAPKNETAFLMSYTKGDEVEPNISIGQISADGLSSFATDVGDCGGIVIAADDGKIVGTHVAGGVSCNRFEPITEERIAKWRQTKSALLAGMDFQ